MKNSPFNNRQLFLWPFTVVLFSLLITNVKAQSDDPFATIPADDSAEAAATPAASAGGKTIIKVPTPDTITKASEDTQKSDEDLLGPVPVPTPTPKPQNKSDDELLSNKETSTPTMKERDTSEMTEMSVDEAHASKKSAPIKRKVSPKIKNAPREKGALDSFDMESVGRSKSQVKQNRERMAPVKIYGRDSDTGLMREINTQNDGSRFSLLYHANANLKKAQDLMTLEFLYGMKLDNKRVPLWAEFGLFKTGAKFDAIATPNSSMTVTNRTVLDGTDETLWGFGAGLSMRSNWIQDFIGGERWSESTGAHFYYMTMNEDYTGKSYKGYGIKAHFSLNYRISQSVQVGPQFGYYLASLNRPAETNESADRRSILVTWTSLAFNFTYYFK